MQGVWVSKVGRLERLVVEQLVEEQLVVERLGQLEQLAVVELRQLAVRHPMGLSD